MEGLPWCISLIFGLITFLTLFTFWTATSRNRSVRCADLHLLTVIHIVRAPAAVAIYGLFIFGIIPGHTAFGIANHEIFAGLSAPVMYYCCVLRGTNNGRLLIVWNVACLGFAVDTLFRTMSTIAPVSWNLPFQFVLVILIVAIAGSHFVSLRILLDGYIEKKPLGISLLRFNVLNVILLSVIALSAFSKGGERRQPFPKQGFWVTERERGSGITKVKFYAHAGKLLSEQTVPEELNIKKLSVRRRLNRALAEIVAKDSTFSFPEPYYESN